VKLYYSFDAFWQDILGRLAAGEVILGDGSYVVTLEKRGYVVFSFHFYTSRDTHKRQATYKHGCLPSMMGHGDKGIEIMYTARKKKICTGPTRTKISCTSTTNPTNQPRKNKELL
jgi:hypothetical protein